MYKKICSVVFLLFLLSGCNSETMILPVVGNISQHSNVIENSSSIKIDQFNISEDDYLFEFNIDFSNNSGVKYYSLGKTYLEQYVDGFWRSLNGDYKTIYELTGCFYHETLSISPSNIVHINLRKYGTVLDKGKYRIIFERIVMFIKIIA